MTPPDGIATSLAELYGLSVSGVNIPIYTVGVAHEVDEELQRQLSRYMGGEYYAKTDYASAGVAAP